MASHRLVTYRAYKLDFVAELSEPIALEVFVYGVTAESSTTVAYVSWNCATEVARWKLYSIRNGKGQHVSTTDRTAFETMLMTAGAEYQMVVEALDAEGRVLVKSPLVQTELPVSWEASSRITSNEGLEVITRSATLCSFR